MVTDSQGSVVGTVHNTDWSSGVVRKRPDPFGGARSSTSVTSAGRGFLGAVHDSNALVLLGARYFDPAAGVFVSVDPLLDPGNPAQFNAYVYAGNNPVTWSDPSGLMYLSPRPDGGGGHRGNSDRAPRAAGGVKTLSYAAPPAYVFSSAVGRKMQAAANQALESIPDRSFWTVTPGQLQSDLAARAGAYANHNAGAFWRSEQGALIYGWMSGIGPKELTFDARSAITQGLRDSPSARAYAAKVASAISSGGTISADRYLAGTPGLENENFLRDIAAITNWENASNVDRSLAVIGSFRMDAQVKQRSGSSAVVQFSATNEVTLGSGFGATPETRALLNSLPGETGPFSSISTTFAWTETLKW
ncbi:RHS repeat-associated core domain-containing protein [Microbacterium sp. LjRoot45]